MVGFETGPNPNGGPIGARAPLYLHTNGQFYGTSPAGGAFSSGTIFQMSKSGVFGHLSHSGTGGSFPGGAAASAPVLSSDGWLWGTSSGGGVTSVYGTIFRFRPETGAVQVMHSFTAGGSSPGQGNAPACGLVSDGQGYLWGVTQYDANATSSRGTLFRIHELTGVFEKIRTFGNTSDPKGTKPQGALYYDGAGNLWGTTSAGGPLTYGTIFKYTIATNTLTTITEFSDRVVSAGAIKGSGAASALVPDGNGFLWGVTPYGGDSLNYGTVFKVNMTSNEATSVLDFSNNGTSNKGSTPVGPLVNDGAGNLWGVASAGATSNKGSVFKIATSTGVLTTVLQFSSLTGANATVSNPLNGLTNDGQGYLWGMASVGGGASTWAVYKIKISDGSFTKVAEHAQGGVAYQGRTPLAGLSGNPTSPWLWGTTSAGGNFNAGTLFRYDPDTRQQQTVLHFTGTSGAAPGSKPSGRLHVADDGVVWGTTETGGGASNYGTVFKYDPASSTFTTVQVLNGNLGSNPKASLKALSDGAVWGTTNNGTGGFSGVVFRIDPADSIYQPVYVFQSANATTTGSRPAGGLVEDDNGFVWGVTANGGSNSGGTLYKIAMASGTFTVVHHLPSSTGAVGDLVIDENGNLWGTGATTVFKYVPSTSTFTTVFTNTEVTMPSLGVTPGSLFKTAAGEIRFLGTEGTKDLAAPNNNYLSPRAVIYEINTSTNVVTKVRSLVEGVVGPQTPAAFTPVGGLYEHTDGRFYGLTQNGGTNEDLEPAGGGMLYRVGTGPSMMTQPYNSPSNTALYTLVSGNTATLRGYANPNGNSILCEFEWGPTSELGNRISASATPGTGFTGNLCEAVLTGLSPGRTYFFRLRANTNGLPDEPSYGPVQTILAGSPASPPTSEISVESPIGQVLTDNVGSVDLGAHRVGLPHKQAVVVRNMSSAEVLSGVSASISGAHAGDFVITTPLAGSSVGYGGSDALLITFTPSGAGERTATLTITSNDADETSFEVPLTGEGLVEPEIAVEAPAAVSLESGNSYSFGSSVIGSDTARTFTIRNTGNADLSGLDVILGGAQAADFAVTTAPDASVAAAGSTTFVVTFTPSAGGLRSAQLEISSNDSDENPFFIQLSGTGITAPEIEVLENANPLTDNGSTIDFGAVGTQAVKTFTVRNTGNAALTGLSASFFGGNSGDFAAGTLSSSVLAGGETTFTVTFSPQGNGTRATTLRIASNDSDENPFDIALTGTLALPQAPVFTVQPQSRLVLLGSAASFNPTVTGDPVMTYQWNKAGKAISGATNATYTIAATKAADAAAYNVVADNPVGPPVPSSQAYLGLVTLSQGTQILKRGAILNLKCTVVAPTAPGVTLRYAWQRDSVPLTNGTQASGAVVSGADKAALAITKLTTEESGDYTCLVTLDTPGNDPFLTNGDTTVHVVDAVPEMDAIPLSPSISVSEPVDIFVTATNFPTGFSLSGLPAGLKFDAKTGRLSGKPTTPSKLNADKTAYIPSKLVFKATNPFGTGPALEFELVILPLDPSVVGTFHGVVARSAHSNFGLGGFVQVTVAPTGVVSGSATLAGQKHSLVGVLDISLGNDPTAVVTVKRTPASLGDLRMEMNIVTGNDLLQATILDPRFEMLLGAQDLGSPSEPDHVDGDVSLARFNSPSGIALLPDGSGYLADTGNHVIRFVDSDTDEVSTFAGSTTAGSDDGLGDAAGFNGPEGLAVDGSGNLYVADTGNATIRKITPAGTVTTVAGSAGQAGSTNGTGAAARFEAPGCLCLDPAGNLYVTDRGNHTIRKITPAGVVTTLAGKAGVSGHKDGSGTGALFNEPRGITYDPVLKALFVADAKNRVIRRVTLAGGVTTYAGSPGVDSFADGLFANARFLEPTAITSLGDGTLIVGDTLLVQLNPNGTVGTISSLIDTMDGVDHPMAIGYLPGEESLIVVHDTLNGVVSHQPDAPLTTAVIEARRHAWSSSNLVPANLQGLYNAALQTTATPGDTAFPQGDGYAQVSIDKNGVAKWTGVAADGATFTFSTYLSADLCVPLHATFFKNTGSLQGECFIDPGNLDIYSDNTPAFDWHKIAQPLAATDRSYKRGFMLHELTLFGGKYTPVNNLHTFLDLSGSPAALTLTFEETRIATFDQAVNLSAPNMVSLVSPVKSMTLKIDPKTGIYSGSFKEGSPAATVPFSGILINYQTGSDLSGHGLYLIPDSAASNAPTQSGRTRLRIGGGV